MNFEEYLISKKIDAKAFSAAEPELFRTWEEEFGQMHVNSFTVQKLNLINPVRRKYPLKEPVVRAAEKAPDNPVPAAAPASLPAKPGKPVIKPKPKFN